MCFLTLHRWRVQPWASRLHSLHASSCRVREDREIPRELHAKTPTGSPAVRRGSAPRPLGFQRPLTPAPRSLLTKPSFSSCSFTTTTSRASHAPSACAPTQRQASQQPVAEGRGTGQGQDAAAAPLGASGRHAGPQETPALPQPEVPERGVHCGEGQGGGPRSRRPDPRRWRDGW